MRNTSWTFTIPEFFRPKEEISFQTGAIGTYTYENYKNNEWNYAADGQITTDGKLILKIRYYPGSSGMNYDYRLTNIKLRLGWEANPI